MYMYSIYLLSLVSSWLMFWLEVGGEYGSYDFLEVRLSILSMNIIQGVRCLVVFVGYKRNLLIEILNIRCLVVFEGYKGNLFIENIKYK